MRKAARGHKTNRVKQALKRGIEKKKIITGTFVSVFGGNAFVYDSMGLSVANGYMSVDGVLTKIRIKYSVRVEYR